MQSHRQSVANYYESMHEGAFDAPRADVPGVSEYPDQQPPAQQQQVNGHQANGHVQQQQQVNGHHQQPNGQQQPKAADGVPKTKSGESSNLGDDTDDEFEKNVRGLESNNQQVGGQLANEHHQPPSPETLAKMMNAADGDLSAPMSGLQEGQGQGQPMSGLEEQNGNAQQNGQ